MTTDEINRAIGELYGWQADYCGDLNAMHEAEATLGKSLYRMEAQLKRMAGAIYFRASARQRAEAFLRTLGKWEEVQP